MRALIQPLLDELYDLHDRSKSSGGEPQSHKDYKLHEAYRAIQIWWQLYGSLMIWAQKTKSWVTRWCEPLLRRWRL